MTDRRVLVVLIASLVALLVLATLLAVTVVRMGELSDAIEQLRSDVRYSSSQVCEETYSVWRELWIEANPNQLQPGATAGPFEC